MTRKEGLTMLDTEQTTNQGVRKAQTRTQPLINSWMKEFEGRISRDFERRTGLDYKTTIAHIIETAEPFPGMQVLDIPTGSGVIARQFVGKVGEKGRIVGADNTREQVEKARLAAQSAKLSLRIDWRVMALDKLKFADDSLDLVTTVMAFYRLQPEKFLAEVYRVLRPGGRLLIADELAPEVTENSLRSSVLRSWYRYIFRHNDEANVHFYSTEEMMEMLHAVGFSKFMFRALRQRNKYDRIFSLIKAVK
jgi:ubiquinone/menaquinone biosynthesis C-methylase UbiE